MCIKHTKLTWTVMLLLLSGVCSRWRVEYGQRRICALKGSSVVIPCSFHYPPDVEVQSVKWGHGKANIYTGPFMYDSESTNTSSRFQYVGDKHHNCSIQIQQVEEGDSGKHAFRFTAGPAHGPVVGWTGVPGSQLQVAELKITMAKTSGNRSVKEGDSVNLTCSNGCDSGGLSSFTWLRNGRPVAEGPVLRLPNVSYMDSGNYSCSLKAQRRPASEVITIDAEHGPRNISVSVRPSTDVDVGGNVTLVCSCAANPAVEDYTWLKRGEKEAIVGNGSELNLVDLHPRDGGQYLCRVINKHGDQNSSVVTVKVKGYWPTFTRNALIVAAAAAAPLMIVVTVLIATRCSKRRVRAPKIIRQTGRLEDTQNSVYSPKFVNIPSEAEGTALEIFYAALDFDTERKSNTWQQADKEEAGVIYSTVCRERMLSPSYMEQQ